MLSIPYLLVYLLCGCAIIQWMLPRVRPIARIWIGLCLGIFLMMWMPALMAFIFRFSLTAHYIAFLPLALLTVGAYLFRSKKKLTPWSERDKNLSIILLCVALPLSVLGGYLQWTHNINPAADGSLHVGQSTYGDLNLHLSIITSLRNASFPADYSIFPGELLSYPFLMDSFSTSFMLFGTSLRFSIVFPGILMMLLTFSGYLILAERIADTKRGAILATLLFFLNGGLGFLYIFDMQGVALGTSGANQLQSAIGLGDRIQNVLQGWYQAPTNHTEFTTYNLRWSNVICDMLIPQRTILGGWCQLLPCLYLLYDALTPGDFAPCLRRVNYLENGQMRSVVIKHDYDLRQFILLGVWAGGMPILHTHSFAALAFISIGWMIYDLCHAKGEWKKALCAWLLYGGIAAILALPQLFTWTFRQAAGSDHFLSFHFNWVNNSGSNGLRDGYLWFYIKNIGLPFILILLALIEKNPKRRFLAAGAFVIFILAEFVQFQPNEYDNNKLFYVWYMLCAIIAADYAIELYDKLKGIRARNVMAVLCVFVFFCSAALTIARECVSDYIIFSDQDVEAAQYVEENTDEHAMFMSWSQHINPVSSLAGRSIVCGPGLWLYWHGFNTGEREADIRAFYEDPTAHADTLSKYGVDYILVGSYERANLTVNTDQLDTLYEKVYTSSSGEITIYNAKAQTE